MEFIENKIKKIMPPNFAIKWNRKSKKNKTIIFCLIKHFELHNLLFA